MKPLSIYLYRQGTDPVLLFNICSNYGRNLIGVKRTDGDTSAERFREEYLEPWLSENIFVILDLDHTNGYASSWLKEAFGGLAQKGITRQDFEKKIRLKSSEDPTLITVIYEYLEG